MGGPTSAESLEQHLARFRAGDPEGFAGLYRLLGRGLYGSALRMLGRGEDAEEAVQETFLRFHQKGGDVPPEFAGAWLHRVLMNVCLDRRRRERRRPEVELDGEAQAGPAGAAVRFDLSRAVRRLPGRAREIFVMHDVEGLTHREIADLLGLTEGGTKSQLFRARELLREWLHPGQGSVEP